MKVYTKQQVDELLQSLRAEVQLLRVAVAELRAAQSEWVPQDEACRLAGRSRSWFEKHRRTYSLPIAMQPRATDNGRIFFLRADCVRYAQQHRLDPPPDLDAA